MDDHPFGLYQKILQGEVQWDNFPDDPHAKYSEKPCFIIIKFKCVWTGSKRLTDVIDSPFSLEIVYFLHFLLCSCLFTRLVLVCLF